MTRTTGGFTRRDFIFAGAAASGGLLVACRLGGRGTAAAPGTFAPNAFVRVDRDGRVVVVVSQVEMGQGTYTAMPMLVAEELEVGLDQVTVEHAPPDADLYYNPAIGFQATGGSTSVRAFWTPLRQAGAAARLLLVGAAAEEWGVAPATCRAERGVVHHDASGRSAGYGALAERAARLPLPKEIPLKTPEQFRLIGTPANRTDVAGKVDGSAVFGIDVRLPGMKVATVAASPVFGGTLGSVDDTAALAIAGVRQVVRLDNAVAVVADNMYLAKKGLAALTVAWNEGPHAAVTTETVVQALEAAVGKGATAHSVGDAGKALAGAAKQVEAVYRQPFLAHATMEPMNCTLHVKPDGCEVWVGTQVATRAQETVAKVTGHPKHRVTVHNHLLGGGFGRRLEVDFITQAAQIAKQVDGPVKVIWTREEDIQHDIYRPYYYDRMTAGLDATGKPVAWSHQIAASSIVTRWAERSLRAVRTAGLGALVKTARGVDLDAVDGAVELPYALPNKVVTFRRQEPPGIPTGFWRGVGPTHNTFVVESFIDELAHAAGQDPVAYRLSLVSESPRARGVLELAAEKAGWGTPLPAGRGRGVSLQYAFGSHVCQVAEVEVRQGSVHVHRVTCVIDCGQVVNPAIVAAQMESGIIFGLGAALWGEITLKGGRVEQTNFFDYRVVRMNEAPAIDVYIVPSTEYPGGVGEPGTAALAPAVSNAVFAVTGTRVRTLPIERALRPAT